MSYSGFKNPNSKQFKKILEKESLQSVYLFLGEEATEKEKFIKLIADKFFKNSKKEINRYHNEIDDLKNATQYVLEESIFTDKKLCILMDVDQIKPSEKEKHDFIKTILTDIPDSSLVILIANSNKVPAVIPKKNLEDIQAVQFWKLFDSELETYIARKLQQAGKKIDHSSVIKILQLLGRDMGKIDQALEQLINLEFENISTENIVSLVQDERSIKIFDFIDLLFKKNRAALSLLKKLLDDNLPELVILSFVKNQAEKIEKYHFMLSCDNSSQNALKELKITARSENDFIKHATVFNNNSIKKVFPLIYKTDYYLKNRRDSNSIIANPLFEMATDIIFT